MKKRNQNFERDPKPVEIPEAFVIDELNQNHAETYEETGLVSPSYPYGEDCYSPPKPTPGIVIVIEF